MRQPLNGFHQETVQTQLVPDLDLSLTEEGLVLRADQLRLGPVHRIQHILVEVILLYKLTEHFTNLGHISITGQQLGQQLVTVEITDSVDVPEDDALLAPQSIWERPLQITVSEDHFVIPNSFVQGTDVCLLAAQQLIDDVS